MSTPLRVAPVGRPGLGHAVGALLVHPAVTFALVWLTLPLIARTTSLGFPPQSDRLLAYLGVAIASFAVAATCGARLAIRFPVIAHAVDRLEGVVPTMLPRRSVTVALGLMAFSLVAQAVDHLLLAGSAWWTPQGLIAYRLAVTEQGEVSRIGLLSPLNFFFFAIVPMMVIYRTAIRWWQWPCFAAAGLAFVYLSTSRASLFTIVLIGGAFVLQRRMRPLLLLAGAATLYLSFWLIGELVGKPGTEGSGRTCLRPSTPSTNPARGRSMAA